MKSIKEDVTLKTGADFLAEGWQHVAYYDDGEFHWMSGHSPRNCELYTPAQSTSDLRAKAEGLAHEARFLCDRLNELDWSQDFEDFANDFNGHVDPPFSRLKKLLDEWEQSQ